MGILRLGSDGRADHVRANGAILGTAVEAIDLVGRYAEVGVERLLIAVRPPLDWDALHAWADEVIPAFDSTP